MGLWQNIRNNHWALMALTCIMPFAILAILIFVFDVRSRWIGWTAIAICLGSHMWMMKSTHKKHSNGGGYH